MADAARVVVVALGGNALRPRNGTGAQDELWANVRECCSHLQGIVARGDALVVTHGNGPQVGTLFVQQELCAPEVRPLDLNMCAAMSQGQIGYPLAQELRNTLHSAGLVRPVTCVLTQTTVGADDPAWAAPAKPIGRFMSAEEAEAARAAGKVVREDKNRGGWRVVVPSPQPTGIVEADAVRALVGLGHVVVAGGGGGVPVVRGGDGRLHGRDCIVDKDRASVHVARAVDAQLFCIATDVDGCFAAFGTPEQRLLPTLSVAEAERMHAAGEFGAGSMGPKVEACIAFVRQTGKPAVITSLANITAALGGAAGTTITP